jgi:adapter protein MecA 1/2
MEFKRINKDTVTCIITEDDMDEQGIKLEDLFEKKKEAMDFLHEVMKKAEEEVDYKPTGAFMPMQITVLPDHSISLTLSENASASFGEILKNLTEKAGIQIPKNILEDIGDAASEERINRLNEYLRSLKQLTNSVKDMIGKDQPAQENTTDNNKLSVNSNATPASARSKADKISTGAAKKRELTQEQKDARRLKFNEYVFEFADISTVIEFCSKAPMGLKITSSLYKNHENEHYYLDLNRQTESPKIFASLFTMAYEFGHFQASNPNVIAHIKESYDCIIAENAVDSLSSL